MPTASIKYEITRTVPADGVYAVSVQVLLSDNIEAEIFQFDVEYSAFIGVATVYGVVNFPRTRDEAVRLGLDFYRALGVTRTFSTIDAADYFVTVTEGRIEKLRREWQIYLDDYPTTTIVITPS